jgi:predicted short-subunit dehydrogenase-like oxidoreductase (DUF2520 family)
MAKRDPAIGFIGAGVLGKGLALALAAKDYRVVAAYSRSDDSARKLAGQVPGCRVVDSAQELAEAVDLAFITTPDWAISEVAASATWRRDQGVVHCCGAASTEILKPASDQGAVAGAFHPFQTFGGVTDSTEAAARLSGVTFAVSGQGWLADFLWDLAGEMGGRPVSIPDADRPLYHAAAVLGCGHLTALLQAVVEVWRAMGFSPQQAMQSLYPLCRTTLDAVVENGATASATGPVIRGDVGTLRSNLEALFLRLPELVPIYGALAAASLPLAASRGAGPSQITAMQELIDHYTSAA